MSESNNCFLITCNGRKASELVAAGDFASVDPLITDENFPIQGRCDAAYFIIEIIDPKRIVTTEEALQEIRRRELDSPNEEQALAFGTSQIGIAYKDRLIVFLHEPLKRPPGYENVIVYAGNSECRSLLLLDAGISWNEVCVFAGVRRHSP